MRTLRPIVSLLLGTLLLLGGVGLLSTLIALHGQELGFSSTLLGGMSSAYYAGFLLGSIAIRPLLQRVGHIRGFAFCAAMVTCLVLLHALSSSPWLWLLLRLLAGAALVGLYTIIESWLNATAQPGQRGRFFAAYMVVNLGALALAQQWLRLEVEAFALFAVVALLICAATLPITWTRLNQPVIHPTPRLRLRRLYQLVPSAAVGAVFSGLAMGAFWGLLPVYAHGQGMDVSDVGNFISIAIAGGMVLQWPLGLLSDRFDRRVVLALVCAAAALLAALVPLSAGNTTLTMVTIFLYGGAAFAVYPIVVAHLIDHMASEEILAANSSVLLLNGIGSALGPLLAGTLMSNIGGAALFGWFALIQGATALYCGHRYLRRHRAATSEILFQPMLRTGEAAIRMHPALDPQIDAKSDENDPDATTV